MTHRITRLQIDRGWMVFAYTFLIAYATVASFFPFLILNKTSFMWVFLALGPLMAGASTYLLLCATNYKVHEERRILPYFVSFLVIFGISRAVNILIAQEDIVETLTNLFFFAASTGVLMYRIETLDKIINDIKQIERMGKE